MITQEALMVLENELALAGRVNRTYDDQFAVTGAKIGNVVNVRRPGRFIGTSGPALNVEDLNETYVPITLGQPANYGDQFHVDTQFTTQDLALSMDMFSDRLLKPAVAAVANRVDYIGALMAKNSTANIVGVAGTPPTGLITYLTAAAYLDAEGTPRDGARACILEPFSQAAIVDSLKGLLVPADKIGMQYAKGVMGRDTAGVTWGMDQNIISHSFGSWATTVGTLTANASTKAGMLATGWASTSTITLTNSQTLTLNQGDVIQIAGLFAVNPQNRQAYGSNRLRNFVVTSSVTAAAGTFSVTVSPAIIYGGQFQNVSIPNGSATAAVTPFSIAATTAGAVVSPQNLLFHRNAFALACADLEVPQGVHFAGRASDKQVGLSIRIVRQYTINNDAIPTRVDVLFGWAPLYPELACRVAA
jgi:hypothetical protein